LIFLCGKKTRKNKQNGKILISFAFFKLIHSNRASIKVSDNQIPSAPTAFNNRTVENLTDNPLYGSVALKTFAEQKQRERLQRLQLQQETEQETLPTRSQSSCKLVYNRRIV